MLGAMVTTIKLILIVLVVESVAFRRWRTTLEKRAESLLWDSSKICDDRVCAGNGIDEGMLRAAALQAKIVCHRTFKYDDWNCHFRKETFDKASRETGIIYASLSASLADVATRECARGERMDLTVRSCDVNSGSDLAINFFSLNSTVLHLHHKALRHNALLGLKLLKLLSKTRCKCHGISGSCSNISCWESPGRYEIVLHHLKIKYDLAVQWYHSNRWDKRETIEDATRLAYVDSTRVDKCELAPGRPCNDLTNCEDLCCGRGYKATIKISDNFCRCHWKKGFTLSCDICPTFTNEFKCF